LAETEDIPLGGAVGMLILFCAGPTGSCAKPTGADPVPTVRICSNAADHIARGEHALSPADIPHALLRTTVAARTSWHWQALAHSIADSGGADIASLLPPRVDRVIDVASFARAGGLSRSGLAYRLRLARRHCGIASAKQLVDWIIVFRLASARHFGATWEEGAAQCGIGLRTVWRIFGRMKRAGHDVRSLQLAAVSKAFLDAITSPHKAVSTRRAYNDAAPEMLQPRPRSAP